MGCFASVTVPPPDWVGDWVGGETSDFIAIQISEDGRGGYMRVNRGSRIQCSPGW